MLGVAPVSVPNEQPIDLRWALVVVVVVAMAFSWFGGVSFLKVFPVFSLETVGCLSLLFEHGRLAYSCFFCWCLFRVNLGPFENL